MMKILSALLNLNDYYELTEVKMYSINFTQDLLNIMINTGAFF